MKYTYLLLPFVITLTLQANCLQETSSIKMGECYENVNNLNRAQAAYESALLEDEHNNEARFKLASLYKKIDMPEQATVVLSDINENQLTPSQRNALKTLGYKKEHTNASLKAKLALNGGYDSNINISADDLPSNTNAQAQSTLFSRLTADLSYIHYIESSQTWYLRSDLDLYYQNNEAVHYYDALFGRLYAGGGYQGDGYSLYIPLFYDQLHYLERDLLQEYGIRPDANIALMQGLILNINAMYSARRYLNESDALRDDDILSVGLGLFYFYDKNIAYLKTRYENYSATKENAPQFTDKTMLYFMLGGIYSLQAVADIRLDYQFRQGDFKKGPSIKRDDNNHDINLGIERDIIQTFRVNATYHYINNTSNYQTFQYNKHELMLGMAYNY